MESGFNENSQMPETPAGGDESAVSTQPDDTDVQPSVVSTDRYGLQRNGKGYLLRKYNIAISKTKNPYFEPDQSLLATFVADADDVLTESKARFLGDTDRQKAVAPVIKAGLAYFEALKEFVGDDRAWLAKSLVLWPLTDQVGFQMYKAASGEADLLDYAGFILRTDANVENLNDLETHEGYQNRSFWTDLAYDELGAYHNIIDGIDEESTDYNVEAIIRQGYQSAANLDTRKHLRGVTGNAPVTEDVETADMKAQILASRRIASQAAA